MSDFIDNIDAVILANGEYPSHEIPLQILYNANYVVCCDGGADAYIAQGCTPDAIIGDGDSLSAENRERYSSIIYYVPDQDTNDQTKAVNFLISKGCKTIAIVGATGKREDHTIGNISLLSEYKQKGLNIRCYTDYGVFIPCNGNLEMLSREGVQVSIFNVNASGFSSVGLKYPIYDFTSLWQGTLNCCETDHFTIKAKGEYLIFMTY
ncbi:MAG: thiamine diphosphokinase [Bacteroidales bacterium]|nr:thiamine diphosphokinase [Bacteroidales bacterium]